MSNKALTYVEIDVDYCSLTWGVSPCQARFGYSDDYSNPSPVYFDGVNDFLTRGAGMTGAADGKVFTCSFWLRADALPAAGEEKICCSLTALNGTTTTWKVALLANGAINIRATNAAGTIILQANTAFQFTVNNAWHHVIMSIDLSNTGNRAVYVDDALDASTWTTYTNDNIDFTVLDWAFGSDGSGATPLGSSVMDFWFNPTYLALGTTANRRKFIDATKRPVKLGSNGELPLGSSPLIYMTGPSNNFYANLGTGGGWTLHGILDDSIFSKTDHKCFNTIATCASRPNFTNTPVTLRYCLPTEYRPADIEALPCVTSVAFNPATVSLGEDLGQRASITVNFGDFRHSDTGPGGDKYLSSRNYIPFETGTYWGKFRNRQTYLQGRALRLIRGFVGDDLADMDVRHYIIDSFTGPDTDGSFAIVAKDVLKLADGDKSQAPTLNNGYLSAGITNTATTATLAPTGVGNSEYPASGYVAIGGSEVCAFTRSGDTLTLTRAQMGTEAASHDAQDRCQVVLRYVAQNAADIIRDLMVTYAGIPSSYIDLAAWEAETNAFLGVVYTANLAEPTDVATLISELIKQAGLCIWWDDNAQQIRLQVLRQILTNAQAFTRFNITKGSLSVEEQPDKRISQVWTYYAQINPLNDVEDPNNYKSVLLTVDLQSETDYGSPAIEKVFSRWIPAFGRTTADRVNNLQLGRYVIPPRKFSFSLSRLADIAPKLGAGYQLQGWSIQDDQGKTLSAPMQITRLSPDADHFDIEAEELQFITFQPLDLSHRTILIDSNSTSLNLRSIHDQLYPTPVAGVTVSFVINSGITINSSDASIPALDTGTWPVGVIVNVTMNALLQGAGGKGGNGSYQLNTNMTAGQQGGTAFKVRSPITLNISATSQFYGGGGGGGGSNVNTLNAGDDGGGGGGGGQGNVGGAAGLGQNGGKNGTPGTLTAPGTGGNAWTTENWWDSNYSDPRIRGGKGGAWGTAGSQGQGWGGSSGAAGGAAGNAVDGWSKCTVVGSGATYVGPQVN